MRMMVKNRSGFTPILIAIAMVVILLAVGGSYVFYRQYTTNTSQQQTPGQNNSQACTQEAKQCPDGSYVPRTGPNCEFAVCPSTQNSVSSTLNISNWKTYQNEKYGFELKYPKNWQIQPLGPTGSGRGFQDEYISVTSLTDKIARIEIYPNDGGYASPGGPDGQQRIFGGLNAIFYTYDSLDVGGVAGQWIRIQDQVKNWSEGCCNHILVQDGNSRPQVKAILSTFKFTTPSSMIDTTNSGVYGAYLSCPGAESPSLEFKCAAVSNALITVFDQSGQVIASTTTNTDGHYRVTLPPGSYTIAGYYDKILVKVKPLVWTEVNLSIPNP